MSLRSAFVVPGVIALTAGAAFGLPAVIHGTPVPVSSVTRVPSAAVAPAPSSTADSAAPSRSTKATRTAKTNSATTKPSTTAPAPAKPATVKAVDGFVAATSAKNGPDLAALKDVVSGAALDELQAQQLELQANDQHIVGRATVSKVQLVRSGHDEKVPTARIRACIDSSAVRVLDASNRPVAPTTGTRRALNLYDLRFEQGAWVVVHHTFPAKTAC